MLARDNPRSTGGVYEGGIRIDAGERPSWPWPSGEYRHAALALPVGVLRFDGVYWCGPPMGSGEGEMLRFWPDGTVAGFAGNLNPQQREIFLPRTRLPKGLYGQKGRWSILGPELALAFRDGSFHGFFVGDAFRLDRECAAGLGRLASQGYRWERLPEADPSAHRSWLLFSLGRAELTSGDCAASRFEAWAGPQPTLPTGATEFAYRIALTAEADIEAVTDIAAQLPAGLCGGEFLTEACPVQIVVRGEPMILSETIVVRCGDGGPPRSGVWLLEALLGDAPEATLSLRVP